CRASQPGSAAAPRPDPRPSSGSRTVRKCCRVSLGSPWVLLRLLTASLARPRDAHRAWLRAVAPAEPLFQHLLGCFVRLPIERPEIGLRRDRELAAPARTRGRCRTRRRALPERIEAGVEGVFLRLVPLVEEVGHVLQVRPAELPHALEN